MIDVIYAQGDDALDNAGRIVFEPLPFFPNMEPMQFRISSFDIPEFSVNTYEVNYKSQKFTKPSGSMESGNSFTFSFRVDKYYSIYQYLMTWKQLLANDSTGAMAEDVSSISGKSSLRTNFSVTTEDANGVITSPGWIFEKAFLKSLGSLSFDQTSSGEPLTCQVTLEYVKCVVGTDA